jgi:glycerophosphoryl diester phosphodiesterase
MLIFAHRGASGYCTENTIKSFKMACEMNAGIETDIRLTKDKVLICFHDPCVIKGDKKYKIKDIKFKELIGIDFDDNRKIPSLREVFECFDKKANKIKYSFDIGSKETGKYLIDLAKKYDLLENIYITDTHLPVLKALRRYDDRVELVHTIPYKISKINGENIDFQKLKEFGIGIVNIKANKYIKENFYTAKQKDFRCFFWNVNTRIRMKKLLKMKINGQTVDAIYTDYPDRLYKLKEKYLK